MTDKPLTMVVHGESGVGKSWLAASAPGPRLILDVEGGINFVPQTAEAVVWNTKEPPPEADTVVVRVRDVKAAQEAFTWLNAGKHPFRSIIFDSLTEMQKRFVDDIAGTSQMKTQDWGTLLRKLEKLIRSFRDLTAHPVQPVGTIIFVCGTKVENETGRLRPNLQGQMGTTLPYYVDVVAYMAYVPGEELGTFVRRAAFLPIGDVVAKDRTNSLGAHMDDPTVDRIRARMRGEKEDARG